MKKILEYLWRVFKWTFSGADAIAKTVGVIALYAVDFKFPQLPWQVLAGATALLVLNATYAVWNEERKATEKYKAKIAELKDKIPTYELHLKALKKYSVSNLIKKYENEINTIVPTPPARPLTQLTGINATVAAALAQATSAYGPLLQRFGRESNEDKKARLKEHIEKLKELEDLFECTYAVEMDIESTRSDSNIQIRMESVKPAIFVIEDNFAKRMLPHTEAPSSSGYLLGTTTLGFMSNKIEDYLWPNIKKPRDSIHMGIENRIVKKIDHLNADYRRSVFGDDLWIQSEESDIELEISINSSLRHTAQKITKTISTQGITTEQIDG